MTGQALYLRYDVMKDNSPKSVVVDKLRDLQPDCSVKLGHGFYAIRRGDALFSLHRFDLICAGPGATRANFRVLLEGSADEVAQYVVDSVAREG